MTKIKLFELVTSRLSAHAARPRPAGCVIADRLDGMNVMRVINPPLDTSGQRSAHSNVPVWAVTGGVYRPHLRAITFCLLFLICLIPNGFAADLFVAQLASGSGSGQNASNCMSISTLNTWSNVSAGDTVHLVGTLTSQLRLTKNGAPGSPITIYFEPGAKFARPYWGVTRYDAAIATPNGADISYVTIDGGVDGLITATDNGMGRTYRTNCYGVELNALAGVEIKNLTVSNLYWRTFSADCPGSNVGIEGISVGGPICTNILIHNNKVWRVLNGIQTSYGYYSTNFQVYSNDIQHINQAINVVVSTTFGDAYGMSIWANRIDHFEDYDPSNSECGLWWHADGIFFITNLPQAPTNHNMRIYRNYIGPSLINASGLINITPTALNGPYDGLLIYNNLLIEGTNTVHVNNAVGSQAWTTLIAYNTIVASGAAGIGIGCGSNVTALANVVVNYATPVSVQIDQWFVTNTLAGYAGYISTGYKLVISNSFSSSYIYGRSPLSTGIVFDQNIYSSTHPGFPDLLFGFYLPGASTYQKYFGTWKSYGFDLHSSTNAILLNSDYSLAANSQVGFGMGPNLTALGITDDFYGNPRPATGPWTVGAFQSPSAGFSLTVNSGSGGGYYNPNSTVGIVANSIRGQRFLFWSGDTDYINNTNSASTSVNMLTNITVTANYSILSPPTALQVVPGTGP